LCICVFVYVISKPV